MDVSLTDSEKAQFGRVNASQCDFAEVRFCASYLLKQGWHYYPWTRRGSIYNKQTAYVTNIVVAYARPFSTGKKGPLLPIKHRKIFCEDELRLHENLLAKRNQIFAHSDSYQYKYKPLPFGKTYFTIENKPFAMLSAAECQSILVMLTKLSTALKEKADQIYQIARERQNSQG